MFAALALLGGLPARSASTPDQGAQAVIEALTHAHAAVVGVQVRATEGARSAENLGEEREGTGVVIAADGLVLTIGYLLLEADTIQVVTQQGRTLPARLVAYDLATGFGLLRPVLPLRGIKPVALGSAADLRNGEALMAATGGEDGDVAMTQLVSRRPFSGYWEYHIDQALFTSPPISNHSGAALFNQRGELLGIGSLFVANVQETDKLPGNMFVPVDLLKPILAELQRSGSSSLSHRPWLGLTSAEQGGRVRVVRVSRDSPAEEAGLRPGDFVIAVDGDKVGTLEQFYKRLLAAPSAQAEMQLTVQRGPEVRVIGVKPVDRMTTLARPAGI